MRLETDDIVAARAIVKEHPPPDLAGQTILELVIGSVAKRVEDGEVVPLRSLPAEFNAALAQLPPMIDQFIRAMLGMISECRIVHAETMRPLHEPRTATDTDAEAEQQSPENTDGGVAEVPAQ